MIDWRPTVVLTALLLSGGAEAEPVRLLLSAGSNYGRPSDRVLQFAEADAARVRDLFVELGGVEADHALLLQRPTAEQLRERLAEISGRVSELHAQGHPVELVVFISAHGSEGALQLVGTELTVDSLRDLVRATGADLRLVIADGCETGVQPKGATRGPAYSLVVAPKSVRGEVFISSSGAHEPAQEWEALGGSLFTHHLLAGLRGDADFDRDGRVTLMEAFSYAARRTVSELIDRGQHPEFEVGLSGAADLILTELGRGRAHVTLDAALEGRFVLASLPAPELLVEVIKERGVPLTLAVPSGRYVLKQTKGFRVGLQELELPYGGVALVDGSKFKVRDYGEVAMKGSGPEFHPSAISVSADLATPGVEGTPAQWQVGAAYRLALGAWWGSFGLAAGHATFEAVDVTTVQWRFAARVAVGPRFWLGPLVLRPAAGLELSLLRQGYLRADEAVLSRSYSPLPARADWGFAAGPQLWFELPLAGPFFSALGLFLWFRDLPAEDQPTWTVAPEAELALGARF